MKTLRQVHVYLGCFFAPMILYFSLSGVWQVFRFNDLPKKPNIKPLQIQRAEGDHAEGDTDSSALPTRLRVLLNELSKPHTNSTAPGANPRKDHSRGFDWIAAAMGLGLFLTTVLGIILALQSPKRRRWVISSLLAGFLLPVLLLYLGQL
jgi:hypothetical protein